MLTTRQKIDRIFHTVESMGVECLFTPSGILARDTKQGVSYFFMDEGNKTTLNAAKQLAIIYKLRFNA